jgi:hypothetical protein
MLLPQRREIAEQRDEETVIKTLRERLTQPDVDASPKVVHDPGNEWHVWDCPDCAYDAMRAELDPPDLPGIPVRGVYDDELGYSSEWLPYMSIEQVRQELGADGFSVIWPNVPGH